MELQLDPVGFWAQGLALARRAWKAELDLCLQDAIAYHGQAEECYLKGKAASSGSESTALEWLAKHHKESRTILEKILKTTHPGPDVGGKKGAKLGRNGSQHASSASNSAVQRSVEPLTKGPSCGSNTLAPEQMLTLKALLDEAASIARAMTQLASSQSDSSLTARDGYSATSKRQQLTRMIEALRIRLSTCRRVIEPYTSQLCDDATASDALSVHAALALSDAVTRMSAGPSTGDETSIQTSDGASVHTEGSESKNERPKTAQVPSALLERLCSLVNKKIQERIDEARAELQAEGGNASQLGYEVGNASPGIQDSPIVKGEEPLSRNAQRAQSLIQEEGPLTSRERQTLESEFGRTNLARRLSSQTETIDRTAEEMLEDLAISYSNHVLTRRRYKRATMWYKSTYEKVGTSYGLLKAKFRAITSQKKAEE